jgi:hypothetical protein
MQNVDIYMDKKEPEKRGFLIVGLIGAPLAAWIVRAAIGGFFYATAAFFTKEGWEKWKSRRSN